MANGPIQNQRLQTIIAGCLRAPDRLFQAKLAETIVCKAFGEEFVDLKHVVWDCHKWQSARQPYQDAITDYAEQVGNQDPRRRDHMLQMLATSSVYQCGVIPEADYFVQGEPKSLQEATGKTSQLKAPALPPPPCTHACARTSRKG